MGTAPTDRLQGTLDLLILRVIRHERMHGWGIALHIQQLSRDVLQVNQGSLYPALYRLEDRGWIASREAMADGRRIKIYRLTAAGRKQLSDEIDVWRAFSAAIDRVVET